MQTRSGNALVPLSCDESDANRNARNQQKTPQKDSYWFDIQATLSWPIHYLKADAFHTTQDKIMQSRGHSNTVSRYFSLAILASRLLKNTKSRSRSQVKFRYPAPVFSFHPEYRHKN